MIDDINNYIYKSKNPELSYALTFRCRFVSLYYKKKKEGGGERRHVQTWC